jgi:hypothetical protein
MTNELCWSTAIVMLAGPIKNWWGKNWNTPQHEAYANWRRRLSERLVDAGYLVYRPHEAFKGMWDERAQSVNDMALSIADVVVNLTPPGVVSEGTDGEVLFARNRGVMIHAAPPATDLFAGAEAVVDELDALGLKRPALMQNTLERSYPLLADDAWLIRAAARNYRRNIMRLHYRDDDLHVRATDTIGDFVRVRLDTVTARPVDLGDKVRFKVADALKVEVLTLAA